jgi:hypothetical protein
LIVALQIAEHKTTINNITMQGTKDNDGSDSSDHDDLVGTSDSESNTNSNHGPGANATNDGTQDIAKAESLVVFRIRVIVVLVLLISTVAVSLLVFFFTSQAEQSDFESQFRDDSAKVMEALGSALDQTRGAADAFTVGLVSYAKNSNETWPFVTLSNFPIQAAKSRSLSKSTIISIYPFVDDAERKEWEAYSLLHDGWVNESINMQKEDPNFHGTIIEDWKPLGSIYSNAGEVTTPGPYLPTWQTYPVVPVYPPYNWDLRSSSNVADSVNEVIETKKVLIGRTINVVVSISPF